LKTNNIINYCAVAWSSGIVSAWEYMGLEVESGIRIG
jgi:hypothetical protein